MAIQSNAEVKYLLLRMYLYQLLGRDALIAHRDGDEHKGNRNLTPSSLRLNTSCFHIYLQVNSGKLLMTNLAFIAESPWVGAANERNGYFKTLPLIFS